MTNLDLEGKWDQVKGQVKQQYGQLTDDDVTFGQGKFDEFIGRIEEKLGEKKQDFRDFLEKL